VVAPPQLERVEVEPGGELVEQALETEGASTKPGARKAAIGGVFSFAPYSTVLTLSQA